MNCKAQLQLISHHLVNASEKLPIFKSSRLVVSFGIFPLSFTHGWYVMSYQWFNFILYDINVNYRGGLYCYSRSINCVYKDPIVTGYILFIFKFIDKNCNLLRYHISFQQTRRCLLYYRMNTNKC